MHRNFPSLVVCTLLVVAPLTASAAPITVPPDLNPGDQYRLAFVTSTFRDATSADIEDYNAFVTAAANAVPELVALGTTWKVIGSTPTVDARDNTDTNPNVSSGVPIYTLGEEPYFGFGNIRIADDNADLWDGMIASSIWTTEEGNLQDNAFVFTGTTNDGTRDPFGPLGPADGNAVIVGISGQSQETDQWVYYTYTDYFGVPQFHHFYAISDILTVVPEPSTIVLGWMSLSAAPLFLFHRRRRSSLRRRVTVGERY